MSLPAALESVLRQYATFTGRARRSEFWWWFLVYALIGTVVQFIHPAVLVVYVLLSFLPHVAVLTRRLHDIGRSGRWVAWMVGLPTVGLALGALLSASGASGPGHAGLLGAGLVLTVLSWALSLVCGLVLLVFCALPSQPERNSYGPPPARTIS